MEKKEKNSLNKHPIMITVLVILMIYSLSLLIVLAWGLLTSLKHADDLMLMGNWIGLPDMEWSEAEATKLNNYLLVLTRSELNFTTKFYVGSNLVTHTVEDCNYLTYVINTVLYTVTGSLILAGVPAIGAYMCSKYKFAFSKIQITVYLLFMMIPIIGAYPSELKVLRGLGMYDTFWGNWIQKLHFSGMYFFVYLAFYQGMSDAYTEAAEIDGASQFNILCRIVIPLSIKTIGSVWLIQFITLWNDYQTPLLYLPTKPTLAYVTYLFTDGVAAAGLDNLLRGSIPIEITACMLLALPILVLYIAFNQKMMGDISMGGIKG